MTCTPSWPGKTAVRRDWLNRLIAELADAHDVCIALDQPALAWHVERVREDARALLAQV